MRRTMFAIAGIAAIGLAGMARAAEIELTLSHWVPPTHSLQATGMVPWADSIRAASDGRINITIYPAQQLGAAADHYDMARDGVVDIGFINPGYQPGRFPVMAAAELPFLFADAKAGVAALTEWYHKYAEREMADTYFCMAISHSPGTFHGTSRILVPEDMRGKRVRPANGTEARFVSMLGGTSVQVAAGEMRDLLASGGADMTQSPWDGLYLFNVQNIVTHHLDMPFYASINAYVFNRTLVDGLSPEDRKVIDDHCTPEWAEKMSSGWADVELRGRDRIIAEPGHIMHKPTEEQAEMWKDAAKPLLDEWRKTVTEKGLDADEIYNDLVETLKRYGSYAG